VGELGWGQAGNGSSLLRPLVVRVLELGEEGVQVDTIIPRPGSQPVLSVECVVGKTIMYTAGWGSAHGRGLLDYA